MGFIAMVEIFLQLLEQRQLARLEAELWKFAEALDDWLHALLAKPTPDWRDSLDAFLAWQESEGRIAVPESRQSLRAYLKWWAVSAGLESPDAEPAHAPQPADAAGTASAPPSFHESIGGEPISGNPAILGSLAPLLDDDFPWLPPDDPLPPRIEWKPRVVKIKRLKGFWDDYKELLANGRYKQGWWESISYGFSSTALPSSEPGTKITFDDGTVLIVLGGGPESGALGSQATFFLGVHGATLSAATLRQAVVSAFKHLGREAAETIADNVVQEITGLPVGTSGLLPKKGKSPKPRGTARPSNPRPPKKIQRQPVVEPAPPTIRRNPLHDVIEGTAQRTGTAGHAFRSYREAIKMAKSGLYDKIWLNRAYSTTTGTRTVPRRLPDVIGRRKTGKFDAFEVPSKTDRDIELIDRNLEAIHQLPQNQQGTVLLTPIEKVTE